MENLLTFQYDIPKIFAQDKAREHHYNDITGSLLDVFSQ